MDDTVCAVVLAAGEGRRLRPLTLVRPKPLCPVDNVPLIDHALARVAAVTGEVAVNIHFGREPLEAHLAGRRVHTSVEEDEPLGTAGALGQLRPWIDGRAVAVVNADTWCPGSSLAAAYETWDHQRARLLVVGEDRLRPTSRVAGALLPWSEVAALEAVPSGLYEASWGRLVEEGRLDVQRWDGPCVDCGTPASYLAANLAASGGASVVAKDAVVAGVVERSVVWSGAEVCAGEHLVDAIRADQRITVLVR
ncbi:MAG: nucleotidyltransferase family protein [Acidimicrobiales bacterium]